MQTLAPHEWLERCARRIVQVEDDIQAYEARKLASDLRRFERTAAMGPEDAVDLVAARLRDPSQRLERRTTARI